MHVCAKENRPEICAFLLEKLCDLDFLGRLYVRDSREQLRIKSERILDYYLNTPEKGVIWMFIHLFVELLFR